MKILSKDGISYIHIFELGKHKIHPKFMKQLRHDMIIPCNHCNNFLRIVQEYNDTFWIQDMGEKRGFR